MQALVSKPGISVCRPVHQTCPALGAAPSRPLPPPQPGQQDPAMHAQCQWQGSAVLAAGRAHNSRVVLCRSAQQAGPTTQLEELNQETFYPFLEKQGDTLTVVDFYTDWCGPCKVMLPELYKLQDEMPNIRIVKFNCNKQNKDLGKALNIRVAPTFHLYRNSQKVGEMTGAKIEKLRSLIESALGESD